MRSFRALRFVLIGFVAYGLAACGGDDAAPRVSATPQHPGAGGAEFATAFREVTGTSGKYDVSWRSDSDNPLGADQIPFTADDAVVEYTQFEDVPVNVEPQTATDVRSTATYVDAGADGLWFTSDDVPREYTVSLENDDLESSWSRRDLTYGGPGVDTAWFTGDDELQRYRQVDGHRSVGETMEFSVSAPGDDGLWLTADDPLDARVAISSGQDDEQGIATLKRRVLLIGADAVVGTDDDVTCEDDINKLGHSLDSVSVGPEAGCPQMAHRFERGPVALSPVRLNAIHNESETRVVYYGAAGPDGAWRTEDDTVKFWSSAERITCVDPACAPQSRHYVASGADGQWFTEDDLVGTLTRYIWGGRDDSEIAFTDPGADGEWGTADDQASAARRTVTGLFGGDEVTMLQQDGLGADNTLGTQDDPVRSYSVRQRAIVTAGAVTYTKEEAFEYTGPGVDGIWLTLDDELTDYDVVYKVEGGLRGTES